MKSKVLIYLFSIVLLLTSTLHTFAAVYEAEQGLLNKTVVENEYAGFGGSGYVNFDNETGSSIEFLISMASAGYQTLTFRFANGGTLPRPMEVRINDLIVDTINFALTTDWTTWQILDITDSLSLGINKIRLTSIDSEGGPNIDNLTITGTQGSTFTVSVQVNGPGMVTINPDKGLYFDGEPITLTASAKYMAKFTGWGGDVSGTNLIIDTTVKNNLNIQANFDSVKVEIDSTVDFSMVGYAAVSGDGYVKTTGGEGGDTVHIYTYDQLMAWAASREKKTNPQIAVIHGKITAPASTVATIKHGANISVLGIGSTSELVNVGLNIWDYKNVIVFNLKIHEILYPNDAITINECQHVWIDHCELHSLIGPGIGMDTYDGLLDIKNGSKYVTVSWCFIHDHMKTCLIGHSDNANQLAIDTMMRVTMHHNYFKNTDGRNPSLRFGAVHMFNNYLENISDYGIAVRQGAHAKLDNNHYHSVKTPITTNKFDGPEGFVCEKGTVYSGTCSASDNSITRIDCEFWKNLPYKFKLDSTNAVAPLVQKYSGVGKSRKPGGIYIPDTTPDVPQDTVIVDTTDDGDDDPVIIDTTDTENPLKLIPSKNNNSELVEGIFPNPMTERSNIAVNLPKSSKLVVTIFDVHGRLKRETTYSDLGAGKHNIPLDKGNLLPGIYIIRIEFEKNLTMQKLIISE